MCSPTSFQMASRTHWPSWSQAPSWCGSPKSPSVIGPSTARDDLRQADLVGRPGEHVAAADAALGAHQPGALQGEQDLLEVGLGEAGALGDVAHRRGPGSSACRASDSSAGRHSHLCVDTRTAHRMRSRAPTADGRWREPHGDGGRDAAVTEAEPVAARLRRAQRARHRSGPAGADRAASICRPGSRRRSPTPARSCCSCSTASAGSSCRRDRTWRRRWRRWRAARSPPSRRRRRRPR